MQTAAADNDQRLAALHGELRKIVRGVIGGRACSHILETSAVLHEAYLRLRPSQRPIDVHERSDWQARAYFRVTAAPLLRTTIRQALSRNRLLARSVSVAFGVTPPGEPEPLYDFAHVDRLLDLLAVSDHGLARTLELVCFGALTDSEISFATEIPLGKVRRGRECAWNWLNKKMAAERQADSLE